jgi:hypothetical protein
VKHLTGVYVPIAPKSKYPIKSSLTIPERLQDEEFLVVKLSYTSSITPYQEVSCASSKEGFNSQLSFGIHTSTAAFVPCVVSFPNPIADLLPI